MSRRIISIVKGTGIGSTRKAAFDAALFIAGIHNFNLLELSSVIPPQTEIIRKERADLLPLPGSMQPVVLAQFTSSEPGKHIAAGLGWRLAREGGIFVEVARCDSEEVVLRELEMGVQEIAGHRDWEWLSDPQYETVEAVVPSNGKWTTTLVCAVYEWVQLWGSLVNQKSVSANPALKCVAPPLQATS
ncbi:MAG: pyruvoyl-dependent arginine decarboxylase [Candidatus Hodarchaeales archaeon]|jgi:arginine decarboxylase